MMGRNGSRLPPHHSLGRLFYGLGIPADFPVLGVFIFSNPLQETGVLLMQPPDVTMRSFFT